MLDKRTRSAIDEARNILVGKIPSPSAQVDQITIGMLYKFMDDMDQESIELGGKATFFTDEYEQYSWRKIMSKTVSAQERYNQYTAGLERFYINPNLPQTFKDVFKNASVPFKEADILTMFLKCIDKLSYTDSEQLGDAYEYLLAILGSQGDLGQFRTPRNIIDMIVEIINPKKNETILDCACGTAGFLISAYKHILRENTNNTTGDKLNFDEKKEILKHITGYDIEPSMVRIAKMNMFLHGANDPNIYEYDTLSDDSRWKDKFNVILANPPFMTPKGGIRPHKNFSVKSRKSEVLFADYIIQHLKSEGRAGLIIPDGVAYQTGKAYKEIRKKILKLGLIGIISLPKGIFNPYSSVKTSILIIDKKLAKSKDSILFINLTNDGYTLGTQRKKTDGSQISSIIDLMHKFSKNQEIDNVEDFCNVVSKENILKNEDISFVFKHYKEKEEYKGEYPVYPLSKICNILNGSTPLKSNKEYWENGTVNWFTINDIKNQGREVYKTEFKITEKALNETSVKLLPKHSILICCTASVGEYAIAKVPLTTNQQFNGLVIKDEYKDLIDPYYLFYLSPLLKQQLLDSAGVTSFDFVSVKKLGKLMIPIPPIDIQKKIVTRIKKNEKKIKNLTNEINKLKDENISLIKSI